MTIPVKKISSFCKTGSGGTPSRANNAFFENGTIPWVKSGELKNRYITEVEEYITDLAVEKSSAKLVSKGSLLIAMYGATVGEVSQLTFDATTNQAICNIQPDENVCDVNYLYRFLEASKPYLLSRRVGGGQPNISQGVIKDLEVPLPPLAEQRRIASILDQADELRQKRQQAIEKLDQLLQATFIDMFGDPVSNPKGWEVCRLGNLLSIKGGGTPSRNIDEYWNGDIPWVTVKDFKENVFINGAMESITIAGVDNSATNIIPKGTLIMPTRMGLGKIALTTEDVAINQDIKALFIKDNKKISQGFLLYFLLFIKHQIISLGKGATVKGITLEELNAIKTINPPLDLQEKWSKIALSIEDQKQKLYKQLDIQNQLFSSLQNQAFNGTL